MEDLKISVSMDALRRVLDSLNGPPHYVRELQVTRGPGFDNNPIDVLVKDYKDNLERLRAEQRRLSDNNDAEKTS